jgi:hypothetical protein
MKNIIVQIYIDLDKSSNTSPILPAFDELSKISINLAKKYCNKIGAEHILITDPFINFIHPTYERFRLFEDPYWTDNYHNILYLDSDVFIFDDAPNIFECYPENTTFKVCQHWNEIKHGLKDQGFNAGVFMLNKVSRDIMLPHLNYRVSPPFRSHDNEALVNCVNDSGVNVTVMDARFNAKNATDCYFSHTWGSAKRKYPNMECILKAKAQANL